MAGQFHLEIITPTKVYDEGMVDYLRATGVDGAFGVMAGHTEAMMALAVGEVKVVKGAQTKIFATTQGFAEITQDLVQLLVESAESQDEIDLKRAQEALDRAKGHLAHKGEPEEDEDRAMRAIARSLNRLRIAGK